MSQAELQFEFHREVLDVVRTHRFRARVSAQTHRNIDEVCMMLRRLWNDAIEENESRRRNIEVYGKNEGNKRRPTYYDHTGAIRVIRADDPEGWGRFHWAIPRSALKRLSEAFKRADARYNAGQMPYGYPRFKGMNRKVRSFEIQAKGLRIVEGGAWNSVTIKGVGRFRFKGMPKGKPKQVRVLSTARRVELQFVCDEERPLPTDTRPPLGIDVGVKERVALSNGALFPGSRPDKTRLTKLQKSLSRKVKGSKSRNRARQLVAKEHDRIASRERNAIHRLTAALVKDHSARFYVEDLRIPNMVKNHSLAEAITDQRWGEFFRQLAYKCEAAGGWVRPVRAAYTSQTCSACGAAASEKVTLGVRTFRCEHCGHVQDRDVNAARNILSVGLAADSPAVNLPGRRGKEDGGPARRRPSRR